MPTTVSPLSSSFLARWKPINPAVPVTNIFILFLLLCPPAGRAFTFLLDEKTKEKNQEKNKLPAHFPSLARIFFVQRAYPDCIGI